MTHDYKTQTVFFSHDPRNMVADVSVSRKGLCEGEGSAVALSKGRGDQAEAGR
jgi:hypothetical protein